MTRTGADDAGCEVRESTSRKRHDEAGYDRTPGTTEAGQKTILAVDDERDILEMLDLLLGGEGYRVLTARGGREAIELVGRERPDLMLLDIMMPEVDGHEVCRYVKSHPELASLPVLMLTAKNDIDHIAQAVDEGADGFIAKPFDVEPLLRVIDFRIAGRHAEFYRCDRAEEVMGELSAGRRSEKFRIVFLDLFEPEEDFSSVVHASEAESHCLLSLWQRDAERDESETTALLGVDSSVQFGRLLNRMLDHVGVRIANCMIFRDFSEIPTGIMHGE